MGANTQPRCAHKSKVSFQLAGASPNVPVSTRQLVGLVLLTLLLPQGHMGPFLPLGTFSRAPLYSELPSWAQQQLVLSELPVGALRRAGFVLPIIICNHLFFYYGKLYITKSTILAIFSCIV